MAGISPARQEWARCPPAWAAVRAIAGREADAGPVIAAAVR
ncbi:hypothetical protein [Streptomyces sp. ICN903]|nr:hypothetical protein [Streptomyces sp. ICN903]